MRALPNAGAFAALLELAVPVQAGVHRTTGKPGLLDSLPVDLRRHMQGKSCFNFRAVDETLFKELAALVKPGYASYREQGYV